MPQEAQFGEINRVGYLGLGGNTTRSDIMARLKRSDLEGQSGQSIQIQPLEHQRNGLEELSRLSYYDPVRRRPVEIMYFDGQRRDTIRRDPTRRDWNCRQTEGGGATGARKKVNVSHPAWTLDKEGLKVADQRCLQIRMPLVLSFVQMVISKYLREYGPAPGIWMFGLERYNCFITKRILKRDTPEVNVMETARDDPDYFPFSGEESDSDAPEEETAQPPH
ncbi:Hypp3529 [Branchiostoma lanceolatum]|uniref:Hypp3529 protein n=1 Tax=Branchiostoma lanceolatum TaxID=7740 RepID=A0A8K0EXD2_BRALA|nr:Hypp3529 [Branchiostoma lanceolatum]